MTAVMPEGIRSSFRVGAERAICSLATGAHREFLALSSETFRAYGAHLGWDVVISTESLSDRPPSWSKIVLMQELLEEYRTVWWIDADAVIVDLTRDVPIDHEHPLWMAFHQHPGAQPVANAGVVVAHRHDLTREFFDVVWRSERYIDHNWWENAAAVDLMGQSLEPPFALIEHTVWRDRIGELPLDWNSVPRYCESPTPAIVHHARADHDSWSRRLGAIRADVRRTLAKTQGAG